MAFCGVLGYVDFVQSLDWLQEILSWQEPSGCYASNFEPELVDGSSNHTELGVRLRSRAPSQTPSPRPSRPPRYKRREQLLSTRGCRAHETGMALAAIAVNIRYFVTSQ